MVNTYSLSPTTSGDTSIFSSTGKSRIFFSLGTFAAVKTVSDLFQPWRVLSTPTVQISTAWADDAKTRTDATSNTSALVRDSHVIAFDSGAINPTPPRCTGPSRHPGGDFARL